MRYTILMVFADPNSSKRGRGRQHHPRQDTRVVPLCSGLVLVLVSADTGVHDGLVPHAHAGEDGGASVLHFPASAVLCHRHPGALPAPRAASSLCALPTNSSQSSTAKILLQNMIKCLVLPSGTRLASPACPAHGLVGKPGESSPAPSSRSMISCTHCFPRLGWSACSERASCLRCTRACSAGRSGLCPAPARRTSSSCASLAARHATTIPASAHSAITAFKHLENKAQSSSREMKLPVAVLCPCETVATDAGFLHRCCL